MSRILVLTALDVEARGLARHLGLDPVPAHLLAALCAAARLEIAAVGLGARAPARAPSAWPSPSPWWSLPARAGAGAELQIGDL